MISIQDSGRLLYKNAKFRAWSFVNPTASINFYNSEGVALGNTLMSDALGYLINAADQLRSNGYFVAEKAVIEVSLDGGTSWQIQWVVDSDAQTVGAGRYLNKNGEEVWNANAGYDYTPDYNHLINTPTLVTWRESEMIVEISKWGQIITIPDHVAVLRIHDSQECLGNSVCSYRKAVQLVFGRFGQQVFVVNETQSDVSLWQNTVPAASQELWDNQHQYDNCVCCLTSCNNTAVLGCYQRSDNSFGFYATNGTPWAFVQAQNSEVAELTVTVDTWGQVVTVPPYITVLKVYTATAAQRSAVQLVFILPGQICHVVNMSGTELQLWASPFSWDATDDNGWRKATAVLKHRDSSTTVGVGTIDGTDVVRWWADNQLADIDDVTCPFEQVVDLGYLAAGAEYQVVVAEATTVLRLTGYSEAVASGSAIDIMLSGGVRGRNFSIPEFVDKSARAARVQFNINIKQTVYNSTDGTGGSWDIHRSTLPVIHDSNGYVRGCGQMFAVRRLNQENAVSPPNEFTAVS